MFLKTFRPSELAWDLNFSPLRPWPQALPVVCSPFEDRLFVLAGFERQNEVSLTALLVKNDPETVMEQLWPQESLRPMERLRLQTKLDGVLQKNTKEHFLLKWSLEIQNFFDERDLSLKSLKPLEYLGEWQRQLSETLLNLSPTSSQTRELLDVLCDLKLVGKIWQELKPDKNMALDKWIKKLHSTRFPKTTESDLLASQQVQNVNWPRGVRVKWERQGDHGGFVIQTKIANPSEWARFQEGIQKINLAKDSELWKN